MKTKKTKDPLKDTTETDVPEPPWLDDNPSDITEPYTDEELDLFYPPHELRELAEAKEFLLPRKVVTTI